LGQTFSAASGSDLRLAGTEAAHGPELGFQGGFKYAKNRVFEVLGHGMAPTAREPEQNNRMPYSGQSVNRNLDGQT
jgi:hypothetical protein